MKVPAAVPDGGAVAPECSPPAGVSERIADLVDLTKPRITLMVVLTAGIGLLLAPGEKGLALIVHALVGTGLVSAGSAALNHFQERRVDRLMKRTENRPLPAGRMSPETALYLGILLAAVGLVELAVAANPVTALLGLAAFAGYVFLYTPLKRASSLSTVIGAFPGAIPPMMGWTAATGRLDAGAWALFGLLFLWQLPHFLAIAWLCREDYARAGFPMLPVVEPDGGSTGRQMVLYGLALLPVSLLPSLLGLAGAAYFTGAAALGLIFVGFCIAFARTQSLAAARRVLLISVLYLPAVLVVLALDRVT